MDHHEKLDWASKHIDALDKAIRDFSDGAYRVVRNFNPTTGDHEASTVDVKPTPPDWSLMVGDIVHNLRSALDNLAYALAVKKSGEPAADASTRLQFPIADTRQGWATQADRIALLSDPARAEIEAAQPFNRVDKTVPHFLSVLRDLSNRDKHRRLVVILVKGMDVDITLTGTGIPEGRRIIRSTFRGPLEENTVIAMWPFAPDPNLAPPDLDVHCDAVIDVEFADNGPAPRQSVRAILKFIRDHIRDDIFVPLDKLLV